MSNYFQIRMLPSREQERRALVGRSTYLISVTASRNALLGTRAPLPALSGRCCGSVVSALGMAES